MIQNTFAVFTASSFLFLIVFFAPSLIASQENSNKPSFNRSIPQSTIQNLSSTQTCPRLREGIGEPKFEKADVLQKTKKLQIPFIANEGQTDEKVAFYANTFGGSVFVTKDGEIVYALPKSGDVEDEETHRKAAKCAKERSEKHISHKDTKSTEEMTSWRVQVCNLNPVYFYVFL